MIVREATAPLSREAPLARLLVAVDNSGPADAAVALALRINASFGAALTFCHAADTRDLYEKAITYGYDSAPLVGALREDGRALVERALQAAGRQDTADRIVIEEGEPGAAIIAAASRAQASAIVIGTHGRRGLERFFVGSVAERVIAQSPVPVIVTRASRPAHQA
jgi:nucleotide-binding universal stress UspA family protein